MEMESSRRSAVDRSREPGLKKPRLSDETAERDRGANGGGAERDRPFAPRDPRGGGQPPNPRSRSTEQEIQELVVQYESALAELTFNSKPIITNLTIIAGENLHAAKGIAATICSHILEVPSEQKLPSLYLLDSIVKNIKGDYIRFFAAKLPEVFCKAYRQVDSSIHPGMRHLFGTWKTVFPLSTLQVIEKELGISSTSNGSKATASKPDSQTAQRQPQSIHVNPKYLEARQRLQQLSKKAKDTNGDETSRVGVAESFDSASNVGNTKQWTELSSKMPNIQHSHREQLNDPVDEKKGYKDVRHRDHELSRQWSGEGVRRVAEVKERDALAKPYYGATSDGSDIRSNRSDFDANKAYGTYQPSGSAQTDRQLPLTHLNNANKNSPSTPNNWKNSEEFKWDDTNRTLTDYGGANRAIKGGWSSDDVDKPASLQRDNWMSKHLDSPLNKSDTFSKFRKTPGEEDKPPFLKDIEEHLPKLRGELDTESRVKLDTAPDNFLLGQAASGYQASYVWPPQEPPPTVDGLNQFNSRFSGQLEGQHIPHGGMFSTRQSHAVPPSGGPFPGSVGLFGHKQPLQPSSPSAQSPPLSLPVQHQKPQNSFDHDILQSHSFSQMGQNPMHLSGQLNRAPQVPPAQDPFPRLPQGHTQQSYALLNSSPSQLLQTSSASSATLTQVRHHLPFLPPPESDLAHQTQPPQMSVLTEILQPPSGVHMTQGFSATNHANNLVDASGQSKTSNLLAAIMKSGFLPNNPVSNLHSQNVQPPLPSGPPPIKALTSPAPSVTSSSLSFLASHGNTPPLVPSIGRVVLPPLPPGPPPTSSQIATTSQFNTTMLPPNPLSGLLNSLIAKGVISSTTTELPTVSSQTPNKLTDQNNSSLSTIPVTVPSTSTILTITPSSEEKDISEPCAPTTATGLDDLIGLDFKADIIREFHPSVISSLFDDLKHQCTICGLRFRLNEQFHNHMDWHALKKSETGSFERVSQKWYTDKDNWTSTSVGPSCGPTAAFIEDFALCPEKCEEPMVPADENQSICALCGEPFEDFYSVERDEWMYKGTMYLSSALRPGDAESADESSESGLIVHAKCVSGSVGSLK